MRITVIGAGNWGTALAIHAARAGHTVRIWSRNESVIDLINRDRTNPIYLKHALIPAGVVATNEIDSAVDGAELLILAAPSHATREIVASIASQLGKTMLVSATKGIETDTGKRISEIVADVLPHSSLATFVCLSGPSFAREVVDKHPTAIVAAGQTAEVREQVQNALSFDNLRVYTNDDVIGTELGGSVKNVMAIAAGMVAGLGYGSNSIAALITRGLAEITRLALSQGGKVETLMGLAGLGDLVLTCTGSLSRNRHVGEELGHGKSLAEITGGMREIAEGIKTTLAVNRLAAKLGIDMPITNQVHAVLYQGKSPHEAANQLMMRPLREEADW